MVRISLPDAVLVEVERAWRDAWPVEVVGFWVRSAEGVDSFRRLENRVSEPGQFWCDEAAVGRVEADVVRRGGVVVALVHTHLSGPEWSPVDVECAHGSRHRTVVLYRARDGWIATAGVESRHLGAS